MSFKYTFTYNGKDKTISIPDEVLTQGRKEKLTTQETIDRYLSDEGYIIDETVAELTAKAKANKVNTAGHVQGEKKRKPPTRKPDQTKRDLISKLNAFLADLNEITAGPQVINIERMIAFSIGEDDYELTLSKKRKPKK